MADSDGLAIATQDTIHPPKILGKSKCMSNAILAVLAIRSGSCFICTPSAILQDQLPFCSRPVERTRPLLSLRSSNITRRVAIRPREFACLSQGKAALRVVQPIRPAMFATLGAGSTPVFGARSLASTSPRHVRNKTYTQKTAASVLLLSQVHLDITWLSAESLS